MWLIELNVAGHRFTHKWPDKRRELFAWGGRAPWRGTFPPAQPTPRWPPTSAP